MDHYMLTTTDNPYSPFTQYDEWLVWDMARYNSNSLLARVVRTSPELSDADQDQATQDAINEIVTENVSGKHTKVGANSETVSKIEHSSHDDRTTDRAA